MDIPWRIVIHQTRYCGVYEHGASWFAVYCGDTFPEDSIGDDVTCAVFWVSAESDLCGLGATPDEALADLLGNNGQARDAYDRIFAPRLAYANRGKSWAKKLKSYAKRSIRKVFQ